MKNNCLFVLLVMLKRIPKSFLYLKRFVFVYAICIKHRKSLVLFSIEFSHDLAFYDVHFLVIVDFTDDFFISVVGVLTEINLPK